MRSPKDSSVCPLWSSMHNIIFISKQNSIVQTLITRPSPERIHSPRPTNLSKKCMQPCAYDPLRNYESKFTTFTAYMQAFYNKFLSFLEKFSQRTAFPQKTQHPNTSFIMQCPLCADVLCGKSPHTDCTQFWFGAGCIHANCANSCSILQKAYLPLDFFNHSLYNLTYERLFIY